MSEVNSTTPGPERTASKWRPVPVNLRSLDVLRGLLATYVLLGHARWLLWAGHQRWFSAEHPAWQNFLSYGSSAFRFGHAAVMGFFVLSGFFIHWRAAQSISAKMKPVLDIRDFARRRSRRLVPPYAFALLLTFSLDSVGTAFFPSLYRGATGDSLLDRNFSSSGYTPDAVLPALVMLPASGGQNFGTNGPLWSLGYEACYYALYPIWLVLRRHGLLIGYGSALGVAALSCMLAPSSYFTMVLLHYPIWLAGAALAEVLCIRSAPRALALAATISAVLILGAVESFHPAMPITIAGYILGGVGLVFGFASFRSLIDERPILRLFEELGIRSYSIYVCHFPVLVFLSAWVIQTHGERPLHGWLAAGGSLIAVLTGVAGFQVCEKHFLQARFRLTGDSSKDLPRSSAS